MLPHSPKVVNGKRLLGTGLELVNKTGEKGEYRTPQVTSAARKSDFRSKLSSQACSGVRTDPIPINFRAA